MITEKVIKTRDEKKKRFFKIPLMISMLKNIRFCLFFIYIIPKTLEVGSGNQRNKLEENFDVGKFNDSLKLSGHLMSSQEENLICFI